MPSGRIGQPPAGAVGAGTTKRRSLAPVTGLSPRVRGNRGGGPGASRSGGSIPACAGEPRTVSSERPPSQVYPRVCGGTRPTWSTTTATWGLSPRVRGNLMAGRVTHNAGGSIPACAGEPRPIDLQTCPCRVYPRVCGGTLAGWAGADAEAGLSPRVRGNRPYRPVLDTARGSIPACAGEPPRSSPGTPLPRVYPRVCGGTTFGSRPRGNGSGLSPRVRGNRGPEGGELPTPGSIPACAGEPRRGASSVRTARVYPRVCGGTARFQVGAKVVQGLSPRVRGNRRGAR